MVAFHVSLYICKANMYAQYPIVNFLTHSEPHHQELIHNEAVDPNTGHMGLLLCIMRNFWNYSSHYGEQQLQLTV